MRILFDYILAGFILLYLTWGILWIGAICFGPKLKQSTTPEVPRE